MHRTQGASLQATEFTQQGRQLTGLADPAIKLLRQFFQRSRHLAWQRQGLQLGNQRSQRVADLVHAGFAALLGVEYGFFQARNQPGEAGVHVVAADDLAHFLHALVNGLVATFSRQGAAHQATAQQVETGFPAPLELFLLLDALEVFFFPALGFFGHAWIRNG